MKIDWSFWMGDDFDDADDGGPGEDAGWKKLRAAYAQMYDLSPRERQQIEYVLLFTLEITVRDLYIMQLMAVQGIEKTRDDLIETLDTLPEEYIVMLENKFGTTVDHLRIELIKLFFGL